MDSIILQCKNVSKTFLKHGKDLAILKNINLHVKQGEKVLIFGRSGQGKSVLLSLLCGLDNPTGGEIFLENKNVCSCSKNELEEIRRSKIGIIFQNLNLISSWSALENVEAALLDIVESSSVRRKLAEEFLTKIGLSHRLNHFPSELSMGEQQRVAIARTLIRNPRIILADEPCGNLDDESAVDIIDLLFDYVQNNKGSLIITSHGHFNSQNIDRSFILNDGILTQTTIKNNIGIMNSAVISNCFMPSAAVEN